MYETIVLGIRDGVVAYINHGMEDIKGLWKVPYDEAIVELGKRGWSLKAIHPMPVSVKKSKETKLEIYFQRKV